MIAYHQTRINIHHPRFNPISKKEEYALLQAAKEGDAKSREKLIHANLRFVVGVARRYAIPPFTIDEMIDEGVIGLNYAINQMDVNRGAKLISFAVWWIRATIIRAITDTGSTIRAPANYSLKRSASLMEAGANARACRPMSHILDSDTGYLRSDDDPSQVATVNSFTRFLEACNKSLTLRERDILWRNAGWSNGSFVERTSMESLAGRWGISETRAREIKLQAIKKLEEVGLFSELTRG